MTCSAVSMTTRPSASSRPIRRLGRPPGNCLHHSAGNCIRPRPSTLTRCLVRPWWRRGTDRALLIMRRLWLSAADGLHPDTPRASSRAVWICRASGVAGQIKLPGMSTRPTVSGGRELPCTLRLRFGRQHQSRVDAASGGPTTPMTSGTAVRLRHHRPGSRTTAGCPLPMKVVPPPSTFAQEPVCAIRVCLAAEFPQIEHVGRGWLRWARACGCRVQDGLEPFDRLQRRMASQVIGLPPNTLHLQRTSAMCDSGRSGVVRCWGWCRARGRTRARCGRWLGHHGRVGAGSVRPGLRPATSRSPQVGQ